MQIFIEKDHIATGFNAVRQRFSAGHRTGEAYHTGGVRGNQAVEPQFSTQQASEQRFAERGRNQLLRSIRVIETFIGGHSDMPDHDGQGTVIDQTAVYFPVTFIPFFAC